MLISDAMTPVPVPPRALTDAERAVLEFMLSADFPGAARLRAQIPHARVVAVWSPGLPSVDLAVDAPSAGADAAHEVADGEIPAGSEVRDPAGRYVGEVIVWVEDGWLSALEYAWVTDEPPHDLPDTARMKLV